MSNVMHNWTISAVHDNDGPQFSELERDRIAQRRYGVRENRVLENRQCNRIGNLA